MQLRMDQMELLPPVMIRILSAMLVMPIFGHRSVPAIAKIAFAGLLAWILVAAGNIKNHAPATTTLYLLGLIGEIVLGLLLGFASSLIFWALGIAGELIGRQIGWNFGGSLHTSFDTSPVPTGQLFTVIGMLIFLGLRGHHQVLMALARTFDAAPPFAISIENGMQAGRAVQVISIMFSSAVQMSLPVVGTLMLAEVVLGFLARVFPQLNAWVFGMPLKVGLGLLALAIGMPAVLVLIRQWLFQTPYLMGLLVR